MVIDPVLEDGKLVSFAKVTRDIAGRALSAQPAPRVVLVSGLSKAQLPPLPEGRPRAVWPRSPGLAAMGR